jgi:hypothetical protein
MTYACLLRLVRKIRYGDVTLFIGAVAGGIGGGSRPRCMGAPGGGHWARVSRWLIPVLLLCILVLGAAVAAPARGNPGEVSQGG